MLETVVLVVAGAVNTLLGLSAFLLWQAIQSLKQQINAEGEARQAVEHRLQQQIDRAEERITYNSQNASAIYVRRDDYKTDTAELKAMIRQILDKLDYKEDKHK